MYQTNKISRADWKKYSKSNLPMKYIDHKLDDFRVLGEGSVKKWNQEQFDKFMDYYNNAEDHLRKGEGLVLCGSVGIAKTWLMTHLSKRIVEIFDLENGDIQEQNLDFEMYKNSFYYIQATTLGQMVFPTGLNDREMNVRRGIKTIAGLWIDDISKMSETKSGVEISFLDDILRYRDLNSLTTFYTSQVPFDTKGDFKGLDELLSKPIHDLIRGNCIILTFRGDSQR